MAAAGLGTSKKQIDRSGKLLRAAARELRVGEDWPDERLLAVTEAIGVVERFRACHAKPLARVNVGLRYYVKKAGMSQPDITQRLKRFSTIVFQARPGGDDGAEQDGGHRRGAGGPPDSVAGRRDSSRA